MILVVSSDWKRLGKAAESLSRAGHKVFGQQVCERKDYENVFRILRGKRPPKGIILDYELRSPSATYLGEIWGAERLWWTAEEVKVPVAVYVRRSSKLERESCCQGYLLDCAKRDISPKIIKRTWRACVKSLQATKKGVK